MNLIVNSDPPVKENYDDLELQLFDFYKKEINAGRINDLLYIFGCINDEVEHKNEPLEKYFDGTKLTRNAYDIVLTRLLIAYHEMKEFSEEFKSHFTKYEHDLIRAMNNSMTPYQYEEFLSIATRESIPKCIAIN